MKKTTLLNRTATLAIAATVAFIPTPLLAQDAPVADTPIASETPVEPVTVEPAPVAEPTPAPEVQATAEPAAEAEPAPVAKPKAKPVAKVSAPVAVAVPVPAETAPEPSTAKAATIVSPLEQPVPEPTANTVEPAMAMPDDDLERAAFAGILALLALGGAATALSRRRRTHAASEAAANRGVAHAIPKCPETAFQEPVRNVPSAFAWGGTGFVVPARAASMNSGGSWVERARRGPTPDNPSLSLKKRLKRAAFFEQRERAAAAGRAKPVDPLAGLPARATGQFRQPMAPQPTFARTLQTA